MAQNHLIESQDHYSTYFLRIQVRGSARMVTGAEFTAAIVLKSWT